MPLVPHKSVPTAGAMEEEKLTSCQNVSIRRVREFENQRPPERASSTNSSELQMRKPRQEKIMTHQARGEPAPELSLLVPQPCNSQGLSWWPSRFSVVLPGGCSILSPLTTIFLKRTSSFSLLGLFSVSQCRQLFTISVFVGRYSAMRLFFHITNQPWFFLHVTHIS